MGLDALLAAMESRAADTPVSPRYPEGVAAKPLPIKACTPVTPVTRKTDNTASDARAAKVGKSATATLEGTKGRAVTTVAVANLQNSIVTTSSDFAARPSIAAQEDTDLFTFAPPGDPVNDAEALAERAAIMAVENGMDDATALQEARWQADRERCWRVFLCNAQRILEAPAHDQDGLFTTYQVEAARRYGEATGRDMAQSLRSWVRAKAVH